MDSKIMQVFYGNDCLPYKDKERTVHYPIIGNTFTGANNTTQIRFYVGLIGNDSAQWVAATQRPKGQAGYELLSTKVYDDEVGEYYYVLDLNSWYTQYKGDIYISLHGYSGGVLIEQDPDTGIYEISGTPTIQTTGAIKIAINYAPQVLPVAEIPLDTLQDILGAISEKIDFQNTIYTAPNIPTLNMADYADGQIFYDTLLKKFYINDNGTLTYIEIDSAIHQYDYSDSTTLQTIYDEVGLGKLFYAYVNGHWNLLYMHAPTEDSYAFYFWDELGYGETDTTQDLSVSIGTLTFHYTGSYFPYVEKNSLGGSLTDDELAILSQPNSVFICFGVIMHKVSSTRFERISVSSTSSVMTIRTDYIIIDTSTKTWTLNNLSIPAYTTGGVDNKLSQKQDLLINQFNIKDLIIDGVHYSLLGSGSIPIESGSGSVAEWGNITGNIQDQTDLQNILQENREIAEGKCKSVVLSYAQTLPTNDSQAQAYKKLDGTNFTNLADFNSYVSGLTFRNSIFNSQNDALTYPSSLSYFISSENIVYRGTDFSGIFKTGDIFIITETLDSQGKTLPDRWLEIYVSGMEMLSFHKLETSKVDLTNYATKTELAYQISQVMANFAGLYDSTLVYAKGQVVIHDNKLYSANTDINTPEAWDSTHWTQTTIANEFVNLHGSQVVGGDKNFIGALQKSGVDVADINHAFNVINVADMTDALHFTQNQITLLTNGKPTRIIGSLGGNRENVLFTGIKDSGTYLNVIFTYANADIDKGISYCQITKSNGYVNIRNNAIKFGINRIDISVDNGTTNSIYIQGKKLPDNPSSTGTFGFKSVNGTLSWQQEWYGTQAQYDALGTYDSNTLYYIEEE